MHIKDLESYEFALLIIKGVTSMWLLQIERYVFQIVMIIILSRTLYISDIDDCIENDCMNGAACVDGVAMYTCDCADGFTGEMCETGKRRRHDTH